MMPYHPVVFLDKQSVVQTWTERMQHDYDEKACALWTVLRVNHTFARYWWVSTWKNLETQVTQFNIRRNKWVFFCGRLVVHKMRERLIVVSMMMDINGEPRVITGEYTTDMVDINHPCVTSCFVADYFLQELMQLLRTNPKETVLQTITIDDEPFAETWG